MKNLMLINAMHYIRNTGFSCLNNTRFRKFMNAGIVQVLSVAINLIRPLSLMADNMLTEKRAPVVFMTGVCPLGA
jgi:hypothetical protein